MQENKKSSSIPTRAKTAGGLVGSTFLSLGRSGLIGMKKLSKLREWMALSKHASSVQFKMISINALRKAHNYALHPVSQKFPNAACESTLSQKFPNAACESTLSLRNFPALPVNPPCLSEVKRFPLLPVNPPCLSEISQCCLWIHPVSQKLKDSHCCLWIHLVSQKFPIVACKSTLPLRSFPMLPVNPPYLSDISQCCL